jgi:predicted methyltransferase
MLHGMLLPYGAVMHIACPLRFRRLCVLTAVTCATTCLPATLLVACGAEHRTAEAPDLSRGTSAMPGAAGAPPDAGVAAGSAAIAAAMRGSHRTPGAADRDQYRHPVETLAFFGFTPTMTVLDVGPGGRGQGLGYYTELLAPVLAKDGLYLATNREPPSTAPEPSAHHWTPYEGVRFDELLRAAPELYGKVQVIRVDYDAPKLNLDGKVDMVLLMREVHMMQNWKTLDTWLREIHRALKPNGILGIEEARAAPGTDPAGCCNRGYVPEAWIIAKVEASGFALAGKSEINANPKDTKDYPDGVWALPPSFFVGPDGAPNPDARERAKYAAIGESDRMTLKFVKVAP